MTRIAIAGAGIAGLTTALALAADGVEVTLLDAAPVLSEAGAGLQLSPNATRILRDLGLLDSVAAMAVRPETIRIRRGGDGAMLASLPLGQAVERRHGAPFLVLHRADLQAALLAAVRAAPLITLRLGRVVEAVEVSDGGVRLAIGGAAPATLIADGVIGADGLHSRLRRAVAPPGEDPLIPSGRTAWRCLVPRAAAPPQARQDASTLWLGHKAHLVHYPVRGGALINVVAIVEDRAGQAAGDDPWAQPGDAARLMAAFADWCGEARALLAAAPDWRIWPLFERRPLPRWSRGAVMLAGDAAHPMLPFLAQGAAQSIEDGVAIACALRDAPSVAAAAVAYEQARRPRAERVQAESRRQGRIYHLAPPASLARDLAFGLLGPERLLARFDWLYGR